MKIAIPVENNTNTSNVCISFGRAPYFRFFNTETKEAIFIANEAADSQGGAGIKAAQTLVDEGAEVLLTPRCGENAAVVLQKAKVKIYKTTSGSVQDNLVSFENGKLETLEEIHPGFHGQHEEQK
jgi:predicted Fe-Mo cluster-binding NifX family protein